MTENVEPQVKTADDIVQSEVIGTEDRGEGEDVSSLIVDGVESHTLDTELSDTSNDMEDVMSASSRARSHSVESILTAKSFARNIPGLVQSLSDQEKILPPYVSLIKCITQRILDEVMPHPSAQRPAYLEHSIQLVVPGAVKSSESKKRYMVIMVGAHLDPGYGEDVREHAILGINIGNNLPENVTACPNHRESPSGCQGDITVAMALPVTKGMSIEMDGDGGIKIRSAQNHGQYIFKPVNLQALWVAYSYLNPDIENARRHNFFPGSRNHHTWAGCYTAKVPDYLETEDDWEDNSLIESQVAKHDFKDDKIKRIMEKILFRMREIIMTIDLDNASCLEIRKQLESDFNVNLTPYKRFIDEQIVKVFGQSTESPSKIFDYLYLGNEWNASHLTQLKQYGVTHVLNVTMEIANFFSHEFVYKTIRIKDEEASYLQQYWDDTYNFIKDAKRQNKKVFVHCRMGVSRSASCVIAYIMKEYSMNISVAQEYVKKIRSCINPNPGFANQLEEYNGILEARYNNTYGIHARRMTRCPQIPEQKLITERWLKEYGQQDDEKVSTGPAHSEEYSAMVREIDGNEKVSEWMERNKVSGGGCCDPVSPLPELDHRVIQPDLLVQLKKGEDNNSDPLILSRPDSQSPQLSTGFDVQLSDSLMRRGMIITPGEVTDYSTTPETITTANSLSPTTQPDDHDCAADSTRADDVTHDMCAAHAPRAEGEPTVEPYDQLSADGPYSPADLEHEVEAVTGGVVGDCEIQSQIAERVVHRMKTSQSFRRSAVNGGVHVRSCVIQIEVRNEAENFFTVEQTRDRVRSAGSNTTVTKRNKKVKQTQSWAEYTTPNSIADEEEDSSLVDDVFR
ncbi:uncharacterized protein LOC134826569 isoform X4 [Bolinopsis microptera]|uniref:uncharacterized protein LOC134826569 isoform X4 n=1 Tax=Bolinopsis microptera TaxID=2820187 RepID=UPI003078AC6E